MPIQQNAHFHYNLIDIEPIRISIECVECNVKSETVQVAGPLVKMTIESSEIWTIYRHDQDLAQLYYLLCSCVIDPEMVKYENFHLNVDVYYQDIPKRDKQMIEMFKYFFDKFSHYINNSLTCNQVLLWFEMNKFGKFVNSIPLCRDNNLIEAEAISDFIGSEDGELTFKAGDTIIVLDMPNVSDENNIDFIWCRGKVGNKYGFFPRDKIYISSSNYKKSKKKISNIGMKKSKIASILSIFLKLRPKKNTLKSRGILKERVFGCDIIELCVTRNTFIPIVLTKSTAIIEKYGAVEGIYRTSGHHKITKKLKELFDSDTLPNCEKIINDNKFNVHSFASLAKSFFAELPSPIANFDYVETFHNIKDDEQSIEYIKCEYSKLKPTIIRILKFILKHLNYMISLQNVTYMNAKNLSIIWSPSLFKAFIIFSNLQDLNNITLAAEYLAFNIINFSSIFDSDKNKIARKTFLDANIYEYTEAKHNENGTNDPFILKRFSLRGAVKNLFKKMQYSSKLNLTRANSIGVKLKITQEDDAISTIPPTEAIKNNYFYSNGLQNVRLKSLTPISTNHIKQEYFHNLSSVASMKYLNSSKNMVDLQKSMKPNLETTVHNPKLFYDQPTKCTSMRGLPRPRNTSNKRNVSFFNNNYSSNLLNLMPNQSNMLKCQKFQESSSEESTHSNDIDNDAEPIQPSKNYKLDNLSIGIRSTNFLNTPQSSRKTRIINKDDNTYSLKNYDPNKKPQFEKLKIKPHFELDLKKNGFISNIQNINYLNRNQLETQKLNRSKSCISKPRNKLDSSRLNIFESKNL
ncbi:hypothetical protein A3Q56_03232 [Intoshia linei]|uniref:Uncharacterized protein n=1 Tax=Intoshia linei TaxID=1819745 RepID=A0A177B3V9_9BILA|nr:hypothetical protein A3Q56_03232 [Intoshia linei]